MIVAILKFFKNIQVSDTYPPMPYIFNYDHRPTFCSR